MVLRVSAPLREITMEKDDLYTAPDLYDLFSTGVPGDTDYFAKLAKKAKRVLELACGTGRVTIPMAQAGTRVTGIELREEMLAVADEKIAKLKPEVRKRIDLYQGDMCGFDLKKTYPLIVIPYRAFQHLHSVTEQRACLECCRDHLTKTGRLVIDLFDPNLKILARSLEPMATTIRKVGERELGKGERVVAWSARTTGLEEQRFEEEWVFEKFDARGNSQWRRAHKFQLRYFYRFEMEHLFELSGLEVEKLDGDFKGGPYRHGSEQLWTVKRA